jgi:hypothetical protein
MSNFLNINLTFWLVTKFILNENSKFYFPNSKKKKEFGNFFIASLNLHDKKKS